MCYRNKIDIDMSLTGSDESFDGFSPCRRIIISVKAHLFSVSCLMNSEEDH